MTRISGSNPILAALRQQLDRKSGIKKAPQTKTGQTASTSAPVPHTAGLGKKLQQEPEIDDDAARHLLVKALLLDQFGTRFANDPSFLDLVRQVETLMANDESVSAELSTIVTGLRTGKTDDKQS
ncbi:hypothetical protein RMQ97_14835 [Maricaulis sp. D1M11]|uniref:hypothetical protein n=1 Tax=Maricaulis sp. D1M11 TaxID=3076117 RepID=UPI0039B512AB